MYAQINRKVQAYTFFSDHPLICDFTDDWCAYRVMEDLPGDWRRISGETSSSDTGPLADHTDGQGDRKQITSQKPADCQH